MSSKIKRALPLAALVGAVLMVIALVSSQNQRQSMLVDTGQTRQTVEATLAQLQSLHPSSLDEAAFRNEVDEVRRSQYVATVWLFTPDGQVVYAEGSTASAARAREMADDDTRQLLATLPEGTLSADQQAWLLAAAAIRAEGEHNDVYRHILREIKGPDGATAGMVGVAYDISPSVATPDLGWIAGLLVLLIGLGLYWLALPAWTFLDARDRGERAWVWGAFVFIGNLVALIAYLLARSPRLRH